MKFLIFLFIFFSDSIIIDMENKNFIDYKNDLNLPFLEEEIILDNNLKISLNIKKNLFNINQSLFLFTFNESFEYKMFKKKIISWYAFLKEEYLPFSISFNYFSEIKKKLIINQISLLNNNYLFKNINAFQTLNFHFSSLFFIYILYKIQKFSILLLPTYFVCFFFSFFHITDKKIYFIFIITFLTLNICFVFLIFFYPYIYIFDYFDPCSKKHILPLYNNYFLEKIKKNIYERINQSIFNFFLTFFQITKKNNNNYILNIVDKLYTFEKIRSVFFVLQIILYIIYNYIIFFFIHVLNFYITDSLKQSKNQNSVDKIKYFIHNGNLYEHPSYKIY